MKNQIKQQQLDNDPPYDDDWDIVNDSKGG